MPEVSSHCLPFRRCNWCYRRVRQNCSMNSFENLGQWLHPWVSWPFEDKDEAIRHQHDNSWDRCAVVTKRSNGGPDRALRSSWCFCHILARPQTKPSHKLLSLPLGRRSTPTSGIDHGENSGQKFSQIHRSRDLKLMFLVEGPIKWSQNKTEPKIIQASPRKMALLKIASSSCLGKAYFSVGLRGDQTGVACSFPAAIDMKIFTNFNSTTHPPASTNRRMGLRTQCQYWFGRRVWIDGPWHVSVRGSWSGGPLII